MITSCRSLPQSLVNQYKNRMRDLTCIKHGYCKIIRDYFTNGICCGAKYCVQIIEKKWNRIGGLKVEQ